MNNKPLYAPEKRTGLDGIRKQRSDVSDGLFFQSVIDAMPQSFLILNQYHQVVYGNNSVYRLLHSNEDKVLGKRPGEVFHCVNCKQPGSSCGNSKNCICCGALDSIIRGIQGEEMFQECRIRLTSAETLNLRIWAKQIKIGTETFVVLILFDISDMKKQEVMEKVFLHDVLNTAGGILGYTQNLQNHFDERDPEEERESIKTLQTLMLSMVRQIREQKQLLDAEKNDLIPIYDKIHNLTLIEDIISLYKNHPLAENRSIRMEEHPASIQFKSDQSLLFRILSNMLVNALEASHEGDLILITSEVDEDHVNISIRNPGVIPLEVQSQIFQRAFSTKGDGRGQGTYSMKLISQRYLNGDITFSSSEEEGTVFSVILPYQPLKNKDVEYHMGDSSMSPDDIPGVLIVDNSDANCEILRYILDTQGYKSETVRSAETAIELLKEKTYRMVLMDMNMSGLSGQEVFRQIRSNHEYDQMPVIALSGRNPSQDRQNLFCMDDLIRKPFNSDQVSRVIKKWMRRK